MQTRKSTTQMTPRRRFTAEERRASIAAATAELALEKGLHATTHRSIAKQLGVAHSLVVHFAPNIEALRAQALKDILRTELTYMHEIVRQQDTATNAFRELIRVLSLTGRENYAAIWLDGWSIGRQSSEMAAQVREFMDEWQEMIHGLFRVGNRDQEFWVPDPSACAWEFIAILDGVNAHSLVAYGDPNDYRALMARPLESRLGLSPGTLSA